MNPSETKYQMRLTRNQWEAIEWAIDCGISAATTQFSEDKETVALVPVLQSVLDEINGRWVKANSKGVQSNG